MALPGLASIGGLGGLSTGGRASQDILDYALSQETEDELLNRMLSKGKSLLSYIVETIDKPRRIVAGATSALTGGSPWDLREIGNIVPFSDTIGLTDPAKAVTGQQLLEQWGSLPKGSSGAGPLAAGIGLDVAMDPLSWFTFGTAGSLTAAGKAAKAVGAFPKANVYSKVIGEGLEQGARQARLQPGFLRKAVDADTTGKLFTDLSNYATKNKLKLDDILDEKLSHQIGFRTTPVFGDVVGGWTPAPGLSKFLDETGAAIRGSQVGLKFNQLMSRTAGQQPTLVGQQAASEGYALADPEVARFGAQATLAEQNVNTILKAKNYSEQQINEGMGNVIEKTYSGKVTVETDDLGRIQSYPRQKLEDYEQALKHNFPDLDENEIKAISGEVRPLIEFIEGHRAAIREKGFEAGSLRSTIVDYIMRQPNIRKMKGKSRETFATKQGRDRSWVTDMPETHINRMMADEGLYSMARNIPEKDIITEVPDTIEEAIKNRSTTGTDELVGSQARQMAHQAAGLPPGAEVTRATPLPTIKPDSDALTATTDRALRDHGGWTQKTFQMEQALKEVLDKPGMLMLDSPDTLNLIKARYDALTHEREQYRELVKLLGRRSPADMAAKIPFYKTNSPIYRMFLHGAEEATRRHMIDKAMEVVAANVERVEGGKAFAQPLGKGADGPVEMVRLMEKYFNPEIAKRKGGLLQQLGAAATPQTYGNMVEQLSRILRGNGKIDDTEAELLSQSGAMASSGLKELQALREERKLFKPTGRTFGKSKKPAMGFAGTTGEQMRRITEDQLKGLGIQDADDFITKVETSLAPRTMKGTAARSGQEALKGIRNADQRHRAVYKAVFAELRSKLKGSVADEVAEVAEEIPQAAPPPPKAEAPAKAPTGAAPALAAPAPAAKRRPLSKELQEELDSEIDIMRDDPHYMEDNDFPSPEQLEIHALQSVIDLGPDRGGIYEIGILPTITKADGTIDHAAMAKQKEYIENLKAEHKQWKKTLAEARRELKKREKEVQSATPKSAPEELVLGGSKPEVKKPEAEKPPSTPPPPIPPAKKAAAQPEPDAKKAIKITEKLMPYFMRAKGSRDDLKSLMADIAERGKSQKLRDKLRLRADKEHKKGIIKTQDELNARYAAIDAAHPNRLGDEVMTKDDVRHEIQRLKAEQLIPEHRTMRREEFIKRKEAIDMPRDGLLLLRDLWVPKEVADTLTHTMSMFQPAKEVGPILELTDKLLNLFKAHVTAPWPGFANRNFFGLVWRGLVSGTFDPDATNFVDRYFGPWLKTRKVVRGEGLYDDLHLLPQFQGKSNAAANREFLAYAASRGNRADAPLNEATDLVGSAVGSGSGSLAGGVIGSVPENPGISGWRNYGQGVLDLITGKGSRDPRMVKGVMEAANQPGAREFALIEQGRKYNTYLENWGRLSTAYSKLKQGYSIEAAFDLANATHVNYNNISQFQRSVMKRLVPFWVYQSQMVPMTFMELLSNPGGGQAQTAKGFYRGRNDEGFVPPQLQAGLAIALGKSPDGTTRFLSGVDLPMETLNDVGMMGGNLTDTVGGNLRRMFSTMRPELQAAVELGTGQSLFQSRNLRDTDPLLGRIGSNLGLGDPGETGVMNVLASKGPWSRYLTTLRTATEETKRKSILDKATNLLTGARVHGVNVELSRDLALADVMRQEMKNIPGAKTAPAEVFVPKEAKESLSAEDRGRLETLQMLLKRNVERRKAKAEEKAKAGY